MLNLEEIVDFDAVGDCSRQSDFNNLVVEPIKPAAQDTELVLLLGIDIQYDFLEKGSLAVPGSNADTVRLLKWIYGNLDKLSAIKLSKDTHNIYQIFHPIWWTDSEGNLPQPFTPITIQDANDGKWITVINPVGSRDYLIGLEKASRKTLVIWPYHCIQGTTGNAIDSQLMQLAMYHSAMRKSVLSILTKGTDPLSEMYGIFAPEYSAKNLMDVKSLDLIAKFDKIIITGQAKSHCVLESIRQMLDYYKDPNVIKKMIILEDTMSIIPSFEQQTEYAFNEFRGKGVNLTSTEEYSL